MILSLWDKELNKISKRYEVEKRYKTVFMFIKLFFQVDGDGYLDAGKVVPFIKANGRWGQLFADRDDLINRCVTFANSFSKGKFIEDF
jgi:hypothetical protein